MSEKTRSRLRPKTRLEQDYWLSLLSSWDLPIPITEEERHDFLQYDSQGGSAPRARVARYTLPFGEPHVGPNPIMLGKSHHDVIVGTFREAAGWEKLRPVPTKRTGDWSTGWPGGLGIVEDSFRDNTVYRDPRKPFRLLQTCFGDETVVGWLRTWFDTYFTWVLKRRPYNEVR